MPYKMATKIGGLLSESLSLTAAIVHSFIHLFSMNCTVVNTLSPQALTPVLAAAVHSCLSKQQVGSLVVQAVPAHTSVPVVNTLSPQAMVTPVSKQQIGSLVVQAVPAHTSVPVVNTLSPQSMVAPVLAAEGHSWLSKQQVSSLVVQAVPAYTSVPVVNTLSPRW